MKAMRLILTAGLILSVLIAQADGGGGRKDRIGKINGEDIYGYVTDAGTDKPLKDVTITAILLSRKEKITVTGITGEFGMDELKPGTYKLVFEKDGFKKVIKEKVTVKPNTSIQVNVEMADKDYDVGLSPFRFMEMRK